MGAPGADGSSAWFTGPGVDVEVTGLTVSASVAAVEFTLRDGAGVPLDGRGLLTQGPVEVAFVLGHVSSAAGAPYAPYTTTVDAAPEGGPIVTQGAAESGGVLETMDVLAGRYVYRFAAPLAGFDASETQTAVVTAARTFDGVSYRDSASRSVRPDGGTPAGREVVQDARCAACHGAVAGHGGKFAGTAQCLVCHASPAIDPDTGSALDLGPMVHRIHRGATLPSVLAGTPYRILGEGDAVFDYSDVRFPRTVKHCAACHGGAEGNAWETRVAEAACLSCHDDVSFVSPPPAGKVLHGGGAVQAGDVCTVCHRPSGLSPVRERHLDPSFDPAMPRIELAIVDVVNGGPGQLPTVTFEVKVDGLPRNIQVQPLTSLRATVAGPNSDYARFWQTTIQGSGATGTLAAVDAPAGVFAYTFAASAAVPFDATGSYTVALEGTLQPAGGARAGAFSPVRAFAVTDAAPASRRIIVEAARCDACHLDLAYHGGGRKNPQYCATCHNANQPNDERVARLEGSTILAESLDFRVLIHKIHAGDQLTQPYRVYGNPAPSAANPVGTLMPYESVRYPRSRAACEACHLPGTYALPSPGVLPSRLEERTCTEDPSLDTDALCEPFSLADPGSWTVSATFLLAPETAACTSCHDQPYVAVHAEVNTSRSGAEACATCHGPGSALDVEVVHRR